MTMTSMISRPEMEPSRPDLNRLLSVTGNWATIPAMMMSDTPLPMPREVICSPSHIRNMVPPISDTTAVRRNSRPGSTTAWTPDCAPKLSRPAAMK